MAEIALPTELFTAVRLGRGLDLLGTLSLFGTLAFAFFVARPALKAAPPDQAEAVRRGLSRLLWAALALKLAAVALWLPAQAQAMAGDRPEALRLVGFETLFGRSLLLRTGLAMAAVWVAGRLASPSRVLIALLLAGAALALQARLGHAAAVEGFRLQILVAGHVLAAGLWLGGLIPLLILLRRAPQAAAEAARRFSPFGLGAVAALILTAWLQSVSLIGGIGGWFGTAYGLAALGKIVGFGLLLGLAAANRFLLTPRLARGGSTRGLILSVSLETALGLGVTALGIHMATSPPAAHLQPVWPFALQPDPAALDWPWARGEIRKALWILAILILGAASLFWRRTRIFGPLAAALALWTAPAPNLKIFLKPAAPESFARSETGYYAASIARGEELTRRLCGPDCFRAQDDPTDLTPYRIWSRSDGDLHVWLTGVFDRIGHSPFAHGAIAALTPRERWMLIDYFRARVAGRDARETDRWSFAAPPPEAPLLCAEGPRRFADLRGEPLRLLAVEEGAAPEAAPGGMRLVILSARAPSGPPPAGICRAASPDVWRAFALAGGLEPERLEGASFLLDAQGWMRLRIPADEPLGAEDLRLEIARLAETPLRRAVGGHAH